MIAKRIGIKPGNDNYARLAAYIHAANHEGEKSLMHWCTGCLGDDDYQNGIAEAETIQTMNTRSSKEKTYHLVISFRPEDEPRLTTEIFKAMEERFAAVLGYTEHQRHCGVHKNTGNIHMHMAYNMVHPEKRTRHEPFRDFYKLSKVCRELETEYGLTVDNGITQGQEPTRVNQKAVLVEVHTGQQSFTGYAKERQSDILKSLEAAISWEDIHRALAIHGLAIKPHGNGLVINDRHSKHFVHSMKASALDRSLSRGKLEARFGAYQSLQNLEQIQEISRYEAVPLQRFPEHGTLYAEYRQGIEERKNRLEHIKQEQATALASIREQWVAKRREIETMNIAKRIRRNLLQTARSHETEALAKAKFDFQEPYEAVRREIPYTSWNAFLQHKTEQGNEVSLAVLRSVKEKVGVEQESPIAPKKDWSQHGRERFTVGALEIKANHAAKEREVVENTTLTSKGKTQLLAVLRMEQLAEEERQKIERDNGQSSPLITGFIHTVDRRGIVIFTLPGGGMIRDTGKELFFSAHDKATEEAALLYAKKKWGKEVFLEGNSLCRGMEKEKQRGMER